MELFVSLLIWFLIGLTVYQKITKKKISGVCESKVGIERN